MAQKVELEIPLKVFFVLYSEEYYKKSIDGTSIIYYD